MGDLERSSSGNATVSEEELDLKSIRADSPGSSGIKTNRGRPRLSTPIKKARRKNTETERGKNRMSLRVGKDTFQRLNSFKDLHNFKTWDQTMQELLKIHPHIPSVPRKKAIEETKVAEAEGHDETETKQDANRNTLRSVVVTRMMTEGAVSAVKVPVLLALASMYFQGIVHFVLTS